jgi:hypothetical protein
MCFRYSKLCVCIGNRHLSIRVVLTREHIVVSVTLEV